MMNKKRVAVQLIRLARELIGFKWRRVEVLKGDEVHALKPDVTLPKGKYTVKKTDNNRTVLEGNDDKEFVVLTGELEYSEMAKNVKIAGVMRKAARLFLFRSYYHREHRYVISGDVMMDHRDTIKDIQKWISEAENTVKRIVQDLSKVAGVKLKAIPRKEVWSYAGKGSDQFSQQWEIKIPPEAVDSALEMSDVFDKHGIKK